MFWDTYTRESLQSPWLIDPRPEGSVNLTQAWPSRLFVIEPGLPPGAYGMLHRMIGALKYKPAQVFILEGDEEKLKALEFQAEPRSLLFFGPHFPGDFGQVLDWSGHQILKTHSVKDLLEKEELKKETWNHLQLFRRLAR